MLKRSLRGLCFAAFSTLLASSAGAQLSSLPAVPVTVAGCHPGDQWSVQQNGIMRCQPILPPDSCGNHGLYDSNQGGGSTYIAGVGTCYYPYTPSAAPHTQIAFDVTWCGAPPYDGAVAVTMYADNTFDVTYKPVAEQGTLVYSGGWPLSTAEQAGINALYQLLAYYFNLYFSNVSCTI